MKQRATTTTTPTPTPEEIRAKIAELIKERGLAPVATLLKTSRSALAAYQLGTSREPTRFWIEMHAARVLP